MAQRSRAGERWIVSTGSSAAVASADLGAGATASGARAVTAGRNGELGARTP